MTRFKRITIILAAMLALVILLVTAKTISDNTFRTYTPPAIEVPEDAKLTFPETEIKAASDVVLPKEAAPEVTAVPAPASPSAPDNIPFVPYVSTYPLAPYMPYYQAPITSPQVPLRSPELPPVAPNVPLPVQPLPPVVTGPVEGLTEPLAPIIDPLLGTVKDILPGLPPLLK